MFADSTASSHFNAFASSSSLFDQPGEAWSTK
jgi:hypothetical protein